MIEEQSNPPYYNDGSRPIYWKDERRAHLRLHCKGVASVAIPCVEAKLPGTLMDLSVAGCCIELNSSMPGLESPRVEVHLTLKGTKLRVAGIVRQIKSEQCIGIEFIEVSSRKAEQIKTLFAELSEMQDDAR
jgi:c-di-GMP-binding flagellar brake protein YcgR